MPSHMQRGEHGASPLRRVMIRPFTLSIDSTDSSAFLHLMSANAVRTSSTSGKSRKA